MDFLDTWKRTIVHIECPASSQSPDELTRISAKLQERLNKREITSKEYLEATRRIGFHDLRSQGTAIFLQHKGRRYLATARHVVHDKQSAEQELQDKAKRSSGMSPSGRRAVLGRWVAEQNAANRIFHLIFRVPSLDEVLSWDHDNSPVFPTEPLVPLTAIDPRSYTFSDPAVDLAVISLDQVGQEFADELVSSGCAPMTIDDIADEPSAEGAAVFTVGYLGATSLIEKSLDLPPSLSYWMSRCVSAPTFSFGRVSMLHHLLEFYWCDMSIYPGNSGGPVVEDGKMVGIVSGQPVIKSEIIDEARGTRLPLTAHTRIPFGKIIKGKYLKELLNTQISKDCASSND